MNENRKKLYDEWREAYKDDPAKAVGWRNQDALNARFLSTMRHLENRYRGDRTILDYGCGASLNLLRYLPPIDFNYVGVDCNLDSLKYASKKYGIPITERYEVSENSQLIEDEYLEKLEGLSADMIVVQGVYQEFDSIASIRENVNKLASFLAPKGELLIMTPSNRLAEPDGHSVLKISPYDAISILEYVGLPYELFLGELGEHIIMRIYKK